MTPSPQQDRQRSELVAQHETWAAAHKRLRGPEPAHRPRRLMIEDHVGEPMMEVPVSIPLAPVVVRPLVLSSLTGYVAAYFLDPPVLADGRIGMPRWRQIVNQVCRKHRVTLEQIKSPRRNRELVLARHEAFYRLSLETSMSLPKIGGLLGNKDHTTVLHGIRKHAQRIEEASNG